MAGLYEDSKTFVDKKLKHNPKRVLEKFDHMIKIHGHGREPLSRQVIQEVRKHECLSNPSGGVGHAWSVPFHPIVCGSQL